MMGFFIKECRDNLWARGVDKVLKHVYAVQGCKKEFYIVFGGITNICTHSGVDKV